MSHSDPLPPLRLCAEEWLGLQHLPSNVPAICENKPLTRFIQFYLQPGLSESPVTAIRQSTGASIEKFHWTPGVTFGEDDAGRASARPS